MCEYCEKGFINREGKNIWFAIEPNTDNLVLIFDNAGYQTRSKVKVDFCPKCGRKLPKESKT